MMIVSSALRVWRNRDGPILEGIISELLVSECKRTYPVERPTPHSEKKNFCNNKPNSDIHSHKLDSRVLP